jgi:hypothetical protein
VVARILSGDGIRQSRKAFLDHGGCFRRLCSCPSGVDYLRTLLQPLLTAKKTAEAGHPISVPALRRYYVSGSNATLVALRLPTWFSPHNNDFHELSAKRLVIGLAPYDALAPLE